MTPISATAFVACFAVPGLAVRAGARATVPPVTDSHTSSTEDRTAQHAADDRRPAPIPEPPEPLDGFWPTPKLTRLLIGRAAEHIAIRYQLQESQGVALRKALVQKWEPFLNTNRRELQPLLNEFLEFRLGLQPPTTEQIGRWAERALPVLDRIQNQLHEGDELVRELIPPAQRMQFDIESRVLAEALAVAHNRLTEWTNGRFNPEDVWKPVGAAHSAGGPAVGPEQTPAAGATQRSADNDPAQIQSGDQIESELAEWDRYVADFLAGHRLNDGQRDAARSFLAELRQRALSHRRQYRREIAELERRIAGHTGDSNDLAWIESRLEELYGPIDDMFRELQQRLETIPNAQQRAHRAAKVGADPPAAAEAQGTKDNSEPGP